LNKPFFKGFICAIILFFGTPLKTYAQQNAFVDVFQDTMNVKMLVTNRGLFTALRQLESDESLKFAPNNRSYLGVGGYVWDLGFQFHFPLPITWFFDRARTTESRITDVQATLYRKKWLVEGVFQWYRNLYLSDDQSLDNLAEGIQEGNIRARRIMVGASHLFTGEQLSVKAPFNRNLRQVQSAGSFMLTGGFSSIELEGEESVIPLGARERFANDTSLTEISAISVFARPGYAYNFVYNKFFFHLSGSLGLALQYKIYKDEEGRHTNWGVAPNYNVKGATGFDNGKYFAGVSSVFTFGSVQVDQIRLLETSRNLQLFVGYRFAEPQWLRDLKPGFLNW